MDFEEVRTLALENNAGLKAASLKVKESKSLIGSAFNFDKTDVYYHYDQNNLAFNNEPLKVFGVQQSFLFPTLYFRAKHLNKVGWAMESSRYDIQKQILEREIASAYHELQYAREKEKVCRYLDSIYLKFAHSSQRRFELGETNYLEKITAIAKQKELNYLFKQAQEDVLIAYSKLQKIAQTSEDLKITTKPIQKLELQNVEISLNAGLTLYNQRNEWYKTKSGLEKQQLLPDISLDYFQGSNPGLGDNLYGYQIGLKIPLLFSGNASKIKASNIAKDIAVEESVEYANRLLLKKEHLLGQLHKYEEALMYYEVEGQNLSEEILKTAIISYQNGEIDFFQYIQSLENAYNITLSYLENLHNYNQTVITINHLTL